MTARGRPSKGHRLRMVTRVDPQTHVRASRAAVTAGLSVSEWLADVVRQRVES